MASPFGRLSLIVNPRAGRGDGGSRLARLRRALDDAGLEHEVAATTGPGDATSIARRILGDGGRFLVAVGGDGTVHEVVNGMLDADGGPVAPGAVLGVVPAGSGCDFARTFSLASGPAAAARCLQGDGLHRIDVARVGYVDATGGPAVRHFANIAEAGLGAATAARAARLPAALGQGRYLAAFWAVLPSYRPGDVCIEVDGEVAYEGRAVNVVVANCRYFGGGMHISPRSDPADGRLDVLVFNGRKTDSFTMLARIYRGRHLPDRRITELGGHRVVVHAGAALAVEADGEVLGTTPASFESVPGAIALKV